ncbi:MAG: DUF4845 domain-containing protein [Haliea sp.]|uniref:DUF4845 domain-containing protein n=1 Tax=Haliea sp. TaxID=1932666 RepID=UPI0032EE9B47
MSLPGMLTIAIMVGFFVMCGLKMGPSYFEYLTVRDVVDRVAAEYDPATDSIADVRRSLSNLFNTNQIYGLKPSDIEVFRKDGKTYIDANYEARVKLFGKIDAVIRFDDLEREAGVRRSS